MGEQVRLFNQTAVAPGVRGVSFVGANMPVGEEDPKIVARNERNHPDVERSLRQFLNHDGPKGSRDEYRNAVCWCFECGRHLRVEGSERCLKCLQKEIEK